MGNQILFFERILFDVRDKLIANHQAAGGCDVISHRLDLFINELEVISTFIQVYLLISQIIGNVGASHRCGP